MKKIIFLLLGLFIPLILLTGCGSEINPKETATSIAKPTSDTFVKEVSVNAEVEFVQHMVKSVKEKDISSFRKIMTDKNGILIVRSFCSGNGTRGKNVKAEDMNDNLTIHVEDETPIEFDILLQQSLSTDASNISKEVVDDKIDFDSILTSQDVWDKCTEIMNKLGDKEWKPRIIALKDNQYALYEGGDVSGFPIGGWFVFGKVGKDFKLTGIFDLR